MVLEIGWNFPEILSDMCTHIPWQRPPFWFFFQPPKSCHTLRWIFLQSFMKFDERNLKKIEIPLFCFHGKLPQSLSNRFRFVWLISFELIIVIVFGIVSHGVGWCPLLLCNGNSSYYSSFFLLSKVYPTHFSEMPWSNFTKFVHPIPIFFAYLVPLDVDVVPIKLHQFHQEE
jgi:hypothetical protein